MKDCVLHVVGQIYILGGPTGWQFARTVYSLAVFVTLMEARLIPFFPFPLPSHNSRVHCHVGIAPMIWLTTAPDLRTTTVPRREPVNCVTKNSWRHGQTVYTPMPVASYWHHDSRGSQVEMKGDPGSPPSTEFSHLFTTGASTLYLTLFTLGFYWPDHQNSTL